MKFAALSFARAQNLQGAARYASLRSFAIAGSGLGLLAGLIEAALLAFIPRVSGLTKPDVRGAIWLIAPLADAPVGAALGALLGLAAHPRESIHNAWRTARAAAGIGLFAAFLAWMLDWFRIGEGLFFPRRITLLAPAAYFLGITVISAILIGTLSRSEGAIRRRHSILAARFTSTALLCILVIMAAGVGVLYWRGPGDLAPAPGTASGDLLRTPHPNVIFVVLDTVSAAHLSCYGYHRMTTPYLDRTARHGVLFENAIAPSSWTLPSLASMLTGLLPHQHGATWGVPMASQPVTMAEVLRTAGYQTAAFNANSSYGLAGWGLDKGFDKYIDAHTWLRHNLAVTFIGQSLYQAAFQELVNFNQIDHLNAAQINGQVLQWLRMRQQRSDQRPYFLFVNYMDAHRPYLPPAPDDRRFGAIPKRLLRRISHPLINGRWRGTLSLRDRADLQNGYDNSLYFLDQQIGRLLSTIDKTEQTAGIPTYVFVVGDHGEGFGEHGTYDHGWNLYSEVLRVPLIIAGPQLPAGLRISNPAPLCQLFATVLTLALNPDAPTVRRASLLRYVAAATPDRVIQTPIISELSEWNPDDSTRASLSAWGTRWHYLLSSSGVAELYDLQNDPGEANNLAADPQVTETLRHLRGILEAELARSLLPWRELTYLTPLDRPGLRFYQRVNSEPGAFASLGWPAGSSQAFFARQTPTTLAAPTPAQQDLLRSLPYH